MSAAQRTLFLVGWHGNAALGDDLLADCVRLALHKAADALGVDVAWSDSPEAADYLIVGGGTLLGFDTMGIHALVRAAGKPYSIFGTGFRRERRDIGPDRRAALDSLLRNADHALVRGYLSQQFCIHAGVPAPAVMSDPAVWFTPEPTALDPDLRHIGVSLRSMGKGGGGEPQYVDNRRMLDIATRSLEVLAGSDRCMLHLFDLAENRYDSDREALAEVAARWGDRGPVAMHGMEHGFHRAFSEIAAMDGLVSQRLHPSIVAWVTGRPHVAFDYQNCKTADFCSTLGVTEFCIRSDEFTVEAFRAAQARLEAERETIREQALRSVAHWRNTQLAAAVNILKSCFGKDAPCTTTSF